MVCGSATLPPQAGESRQTRYTVVIDVPSTLAPTSRRWNQAYRIRSTGYSVLAGAARAAPRTKAQAMLVKNTA